MKEQTLKFLYTRLKKPELTKEQAQSKVCQEILISKIGNNPNLVKKVAFKGGIIIDSLSHGKRGFTKDIDFDLINYPLSNEGLNDFINQLNEVDSFEEIKIIIKEIQELRHKNYQGKRLLLLFKDKENAFELTTDIGVSRPSFKKETIYEYKIAFGNETSLFIDPIERMIAEKLSTFAIYGTDNTREKDLFDAYFLIKTFAFEKEIVKKILENNLIKRKAFFKDFIHIIDSINKTINDSLYKKVLENSKRNWIEEDIKTVIIEIETFLKSLL